MLTQKEENPSNSETATDYLDEKCSHLWKCLVLPHSQLSSYINNTPYTTSWAHETKV